MSFMSSFDENIKLVKPQVDTVASASKSLKNSTKMKKILELILALGNYMNSTKKGPAYGFRLQSLDSLSITKSSDKKKTLVHFLAELVSNKYPELKNFHAELKFIDKAAQFSLENILTDVRELEKGMELTKKELDNRLAAPINATSTREQQRIKDHQNASLQDFVDKASDLVSKLRMDTDSASFAFKQCVEFFGEEPKSMDCNTLFGYLVRFVATWKSAEEDNVKRQRMLEMQAKEEKAKNTQREESQTIKSAVINELKSRNNRFKMPLPKPEEFQDGTFEDIIMGMKSQPYRNNINEGKRKSFRKRGLETSLSTGETEPL